MINQGFHLRRNVIVSVLAFAVNLVLTFLVYRLVISVGGLGSLGLWSTLMSWIFLVRLGDLGMGTAVVRFVSGCEASHETSRIRAYIDTSLLLNLGLFVVLAVIGYFLFLANLDWIIPNDPAHPEARGLAADVLPVMFTAFVLSNISGLMLGGLTGLHKGYKPAIVTTFGMMVQLCIVVPLVPRIGLAGLAWGQFGQHAVMILVGWALVLRDLKAAAGGHGGIWPRHFSRPALQEMLGYSLKTQLSNIINGLFEPVSKILVGQIGGLTLLGQYELAYKFVSLPRNALAAGAQATTPAMTRLLGTDRKAARDLYGKTQKNLLSKGSFVLLAAVCVAPFASIFWLGQLDRDFWIYTAILAAGFWVNLMSAPAYLLGLQTGQIFGNIVANTGALATMILGSVLGGMFIGTTAQVAGVAVGLMVGAALVYRMNRPILMRDI